MSRHTCGHVWRIVPCYEIMMPFMPRYESITLSCHCSRHENVRSVECGSMHFSLTWTLVVSFSLGCFNSREIIRGNFYMNPRAVPDILQEKSIAPSRKWTPIPLLLPGTERRFHCSFQELKADSIAPSRNWTPIPLLLPGTERRFHCSF